MRIEQKNTFRIKSAYAPMVQKTEKENTESRKQQNMKLQKSLQDSITNETKILKSDFIEKYEIINKQLKMKVDKAIQINKTVKKQFKENEDFYKTLQNEVEINEYQGETNKLDVKIINFKLNLKQIRQEIDTTNKQFQNIKKKIKNNDCNENELAILDNKIQLEREEIVEKMESEEKQQNLEEMSRVQMDEYYQWKKEEIFQQQMAQRLEEEQKSIQQTEHKKIMAQKQQINLYQNLIVQFKNRIKNFKHNSREQYQENIKKQKMDQNNKQIIKMISQKRQVIQEAQIQKHALIQSVINQKNCQYKNTNKKEQYSNFSSRSSSFNKENSQQNMSISSPMIPQKLRLSFMNDIKNDTYLSETEKNTKIYFNFLKHKLIKLKISDTEVYSFFEKIIETETVNLLSIKQILHNFPFNFKNEYNIDEFCRKLLDGRLLENSQLVNHPKKKIIKKIIKYLGFYFTFEDDTEAAINYKQFLKININNITIDYELNNNIDPNELLPIFGDSWPNLQILINEYIDMFPQDEKIKNPHLQQLVKTYKTKYCQQNIRGQKTSFRI